VADAELLERTGAKVVQVGGGCGLAGNFGFERGHDEYRSRCSSTI
jgi:hypothetical protein